MNKVILRCLLLLLATIKSCGAFTVPPSSPARPTIRRIEGNNLIESGLFRSYHNVVQSSDDGKKKIKFKVARFVKNVSQKLQTIRSALPFRFSSVLSGKNKKRYLSILAAAVISFGAFPSQATAEPVKNSMPPTTIVAKNIRTATESPFAQNAVRVSDYRVDIEADSLFGTNLLPTDGYATDGYNTFINAIGTQFDTTVLDCAYTPTAFEDTAQTGDDFLILNDRMLKNGIRNIAVVSTGAAALLSVRRKAVRRSSGDANGVELDEKIISSFSEKDTVDIAYCEAGKGQQLLPLSDRKYVQARKQPKPQKEEATLAAQYAGILTLEERAFQILVDLGMIEVSR